jgi:hypothetical protein
MSFRVKPPQQPKVGTNPNDNSKSSLMSFLDDAKSNVNILDYSSIQSSQPSQREAKPKASFSLNRTNGAAVDMN